MSWSWIASYTDGTALHSGAAFSSMDAALGAGLAHYGYDMCASQKELQEIRVYKVVKGRFK